jgi:hypothetical protein
MSQSSSWWSGLPLLTWPAVDRRALAWLLPRPPSSALVLDARFVRPLRALGCALLLPDRGAALSPGDVTVPLLCAQVESSDFLAAVRRCAELTAVGGTVVLRSPARERERLAAAFLHSGLIEVQQVRTGRQYLTAGIVT